MYRLGSVRLIWLQGVNATQEGRSPYRPGNPLFSPRAIRPFLPRARRYAAELAWLKGDPNTHLAHTYDHTLPLYSACLELLFRYGDDEDARLLIDDMHAAVDGIAQCRFVMRYGTEDDLAEAAARVAREPPFQRGESDEPRDDLVRHMAVRAFFKMKGLTYPDRTTTQQQGVPAKP